MIYNFNMSTTTTISELEATIKSTIEFAERTRKGYFYGMGQKSKEGADINYLNRVLAEDKALMEKLDGQIEKMQEELEELKK